MVKKTKIVLEPKDVALTLGVLFAALHAAWVVIVAVGFGDVTLGWLQGMHFVAGKSMIAFDVTTGIIGIVGAFISGIVTGWLFALIWNWLSK